MENTRFTVAGGDLRNLKLAQLLKNDGHEVYIYGFEKANFKPDLIYEKSLHDSISKSDIVLGPVPCSNDNESLNTPFSEEKVNIYDFFREMDRKQIFIAGRISPKIMHLSKALGVYCCDILEREEMSVLNAIPTAEGAIQTAMEEMPTTLHGSNAIVLGFGRIGKILSKMLAGIGCNVYAEARKHSDIAWIRSYGYHPVQLNLLKEYLPLMDVIFNTVPEIILDEDLLSCISNDCLLIDLASKPGGIDFECAARLGKKTIWALSLPGKVAPVTAAIYIKETVYNILRELGV